MEQACNRDDEIKTYRDLESRGSPSSLEGEDVKERVRETPMRRGSLLSKAALEELRPLLNYVNVSSGSGSELSGFCRKHHVPTKIHIESSNGRIVSTREADRKAILLARILKYLETGVMPPPTVFPRKVISDAALPKPLKETHRVYYGQYKNGNAAIAKLLESLTGGVSTYCAIGQEVIRDFWSRGIAPTYAEFAESFVKAYRAHKTSDNPEWAYLNDLQKAKEAGQKFNKRTWRTEIRPAKARQALDLLDKIKVPGKKNETPRTLLFDSKRGALNKKRTKRKRSVSDKDEREKRQFKKRVIADENGKPTASVK